jgi:Dyp-type peroxidase family
MPVDLSKGPIDPQHSDYQNMLSNLQGNILKPHARDHAVHMFLKFKAEAAAVRRWMRDFVQRYVTSAQLQIKEASDFRVYRVPGKLFGHLCLSAHGYRALGFTEDQIQGAFPSDQGHRPLVFGAGMAAQAQRLNDPSPETWDKAYRDRKIDAMILLADDDEGFMLRHVRTVLDNVAAVAEVLTVEHGHVLRNDQHNPVEPFGYADGRSQPLFLQGDVTAQQTSSKPVWDPAAPLDLVLLPDLLAPAGADCFGSYLVFRKLEQNIREFHTRIQALARTLGCNKSMAKALVIGRFDDGTPLVLSDTPEANQAAANDFNYSQDRIGDKCPFHAHIRRLNPRGESAVNQASSADVAAERRHRIARRSIPYGVSSGAMLDYGQVDQLPTCGVGVLFMCFQRSLSNQFGFLQTVWANSATKSDGSQLVIGLDPIIGRPAANQPVTGQPRWPVQWGKPLFKSFDFHSFVTLRGGEFLFAPSLPFFQNL